MVVNENSHFIVLSSWVLFAVLAMYSHFYVGNGTSLFHNVGCSQHRWCWQQNLSSFLYLALLYMGDIPWCSFNIPLDYLSKKQNKTKSQLFLTAPIMWHYWSDVRCHEILFLTPGQVTVSLVAKPFDSLYLNDLLGLEHGCRLFNRSF